MSFSSRSQAGLVPIDRGTAQDYEFVFVRNEKVMKTLLHHKRKDLYFKGVSEWTNNLDAAFDFCMAERALRFVRDAKLPRTEFELILSFENAGFNVTIPVDHRFEKQATTGQQVVSKGGGHVEVASASGRSVPGRSISEG